MVNSDHIKQSDGTVHAANPPAKTVTLHVIPVIEGISPQLALGGEVVRGDAGHFRRHALAIQKELLKKADARQDFGDLADQIDALRDEKQRLLLEDANNTGLQQQLKTIEDFLAEQQEAVTEYEEALVRKLISKITVFDDKLVVEFKSGLETEVKM
jgi:hypothetical protein